MIRERLAPHRGAEVKTEGDSFYIAFTSPSDAIDFAVDVFRAAVDRRPRLRFGIGIHAGETVPLEGQYVGSAVNIAARVGSIAGEGELLVTDTVRGLVRTSSPYALGDRGEVALKGVSERMRLYAVEWRPRTETVALAAEELELELTLPAGATTTLVGREVELRELETLTGSLRGGAGGTVLVAGPAGIGKSRLVREWAAEGELSLLAGGCGQTDTHAPYEPFLEMLRRLTHRAPGEALIRRVSPELVALLPELAADRPRNTDRDALFGSFLRLVREIARSRPLGIFLDDLHWAEESSLALFRFLAMQSAVTPFLLVATYRDDELVRGHPLRPLIAELARRADVRSLTLVELDETRANELIDATHGTLGERQRARIVELAGGNPLVLEELARAGGEDGSALPLTLAEAILRRVAALDELGRRLVTYAAVSGMQVDFDLLVRLLGAPEREVLQAARAAIDATILVERDDTLVFRHALVREAVYRELMKREQRLLHEEVAEALVAARGGEPAVADEIERHFESAGHPERALPFALAAGEYALGILAPDSAATHFERAVDAAAPASLERARGLEGLGNAYRMQLKVGKAVATLRDAADLFDRAGTPADRFRVRRSLARALPFGVEERQAQLDAWRVGEGVASNDERTSLAMTLASRAYQFMDDADAARWLATARKLASASPHGALTARVERLAREIERGPGWHAVEERELALQLDRALERDEGVLLAYRRYLDMRARDADADERDAVLARARSYAERSTPDVPRAIVFRYGPPWMSWCAGEWDEVAALWEELQRRFAGDDLAEIFPDTGPIDAAIQIEREGPEAGGAAALRVLVERQRRTATWRGRTAAAAHLANLHLVSGRARDVVAELDPLVSTRGPYALEVPMLILVARVMLPAILLLRDASALAPWLAAIPALGASGAALAAVAAHAAAIDAAMRGDRGASRERFDAARELYRQRGWGHLAAELAWQSAAQGDESDMETALSFYRSRGAAWRARWLEEGRWR